MKDLNDNEIKIGSKVFFMHSKSEPIIGIVSEFLGRKTFLVKYSDIIKCLPKTEKHLAEKAIINPGFLESGNGFVGNCDKCAVLKNPK